MTHVEFEDDSYAVGQQRREYSERDDDTRDGDVTHQGRRLLEREHGVLNHLNTQTHNTHTCLLYTSDAADE